LSASVYIDQSCERRVACYRRRRKRAIFARSQTASDGLPILLAGESMDQFDSTFAALENVFAAKLKSCV